ncbi:MAG: hypothetical protein J0H15_13715 [Xanthomonadales bacterium]|nr:hypothetical protein [Xanthomonadales bacterium]
MTQARTARTHVPRLSAIASCVLAVFGTAASQAIDPGIAHAAAPAHAVRSNHAAATPRIQRDRSANRRDGDRRGAARPAPTRPATTLIVDNCNDSGPGSLRDTLTSAVSGDSIDLTGLACSTITLTSGALYADGDFEVVGPGRDLLTIDGNASDLILVHYGDSLNISGVTIANGRSTSGIGGCLWTSADLQFVDSTVTGCVAGDGSNSNAYGAGLDVIGNLVLYNSVVRDNAANGTEYVIGGGIYVGGDVYLADASVVSGNAATVSSDMDGAARGGGLFARGLAGVIEGSRISDNRVEATGDGTAFGGGIHVYGGSAVALVGATVSGNTAHAEQAWSYGGGINAGEYSDTGGGVLIIQSTVSGNTTSSNCATCFIQGGGVNAFDQISAKYSTISDNHVLSAAGSQGYARGGGLSAFSPDGTGSIQVVQSTISGNTVRGGDSGNGAGYGGGVTTSASSLYLINSTVAFNTASHWAGGLALYGPYGSADPTTTVLSSIIAGNEAPLNVEIGSPDWGPPSVEVSGSNNLLMVAPDAAVVLPADTLFADPLLQPLRRNGGPTATHAIPACSPAIDAGINPSDLDFDQRNDPYVRVFADGVDIGAFEFQPDLDLIFAHGFEPSPCP